MPRKTILALVIIGLAFISTRFARAQDTEAERLYVVNSDGTNLAPLPLDPQHGYWGPAWSPDGTRVAVSVYTPGTPTGQLYVLSLDTMEMTRLTNNGRNNYLPQWSPDGEALAYISQDGDRLDTTEIYTIRAHGTDETRLTNNDAQEYGVSWSPDGTTLVFGVFQDDDWQIYTMNADGSNQRPLSTAAHGNAVRWSPDGQTLAYVSDTGMNLTEIVRANPDGSEQQSLTNNSASDSQIAWSPDSTRLAFVSGRDGGMPTLYTMAADGSDVQRVIHDPSLIPQIPSWSPDGTRIVFHASRAFAPQPAVLDDTQGWVITGVVIAVMLFLIALVNFYPRRAPEKGDTP